LISGLTKGLICSLVVVGIPRFFSILISSSLYLLLLSNSFSEAELNSVLFSLTSIDELDDICL
jgi:hypothetical protein